MTAPWMERRESMTLFSSSAQNGHFMGGATRSASTAPLRVERERPRQIPDFPPDTADLGFVPGVIQHPHDQPRDALHLARTHAPGGERRRAQAQPGGDEGLLWVSGDHVLVGGD